MRNKTRKFKTKKFSSGKYAKAICDRTGIEHPLREMIKEPGTGYFVHRSVSDGAYNAVDHPQNFSFEGSDAIGLKETRTDREEPSVLKKDSNGNIVTTDDGFLIYLDETGTEIISNILFVE